MICYMHNFIHFIGHQTVNSIGTLQSSILEIFLNYLYSLWTNFLSFMFMFALLIFSMLSFCSVSWEISYIYLETLLLSLLFILLWFSFPKALSNFLIMFYSIQFLFHGCNSVSYLSENNNRHFKYSFAASSIIFKLFYFCFWWTLSFLLENFLCYLVILDIMSSCLSSEQDAVVDWELWSCGWKLLIIGFPVVWSSFTIFLELGFSRFFLLVGWNSIHTKDRFELAVFHVLLFFFIFSISLSLYVAYLINLFSFIFQFTVISVV